MFTKSLIHLHRLLGCYSVQSGTQTPVFRKNFLHIHPPVLKIVAVGFSSMSLPACQTVRMTSQKTVISIVATMRAPDPTWEGKEYVHTFCVGIWRCRREMQPIRGGEWTLYETHLPQALHSKLRICRWSVCMLLYSASVLAASILKSVVFILVSERKMYNGI